MLSPITRLSLKGKVRICDQLKKETDELIVWWYGGIAKNYRAETVPKVVVFFRKLDQNGNLGSSVRMSIALTFLGLLRIGSIWKEGICQSEAVIPEDHQKFNVDFTRGTWKFVSPSQAAQNGNESPINQLDYPLHFPHDKNWLLDFPLENGKNLLIPCLEFLSRCYGRSEEVPRVLVTYGWSKVLKHFYAPFDQPVTPNTWPVKLKRRMYNGDVVFLAHMKYDTYTERAAKEIDSQVEISFLNKAPFAFVQVEPWFQGKAQVIVSGIWINNGKTFLALRVLGCSDPQEATILRDRENPNKTNGPAEGDNAGKAWDGAPPRILKKPPEIVDMTGDQEPDHGAATIEIEEPEFIVPGEQRVVIDVRRDRTTTSAGKPGDGGNPGAFSSGEHHGTGKGIGHASIHAKAVMESKGMLRDMWDALLYLRKKNSGTIRSVEWFTFEDGFVASDEPHLIGLHPFDADDKVEPAVRRWPFLDISIPTIRGMLVARVTTTKDKQIYIIELQRRPRIKTDDQGNQTLAEDSFKGIVFKLNEQNGFDEWIKYVRSQVRHVEGIVSHLISECPGFADTFSHRRNKDGKVSCEAAAIKALSKVGVIIEH